MQDVVVALIKDNHDAYLSLKRSKDDAWSFPSGKVEEGETERDAVKREVFEETRIICEPVEKIGERVIGDKVRLNYWTAHYISGEAQAPADNEVTDVGFRTIAELLVIIPVEKLHESVRKELKI